MLLSRPLIICIHTQNGCRLQMRSVAHDQNVVSIAEAPRQKDFCTGPPVGYLLNAKVQRATSIRPGVVGVVWIVHSPAIARDGAHFPIVAAEMQRFGGCELRFTNAFHDRYQHHGTALGWRYIHGRRWTITWINQQCSILPSQMSFDAPR